MYGQPLIIPPDADRVAMEAARQALEATLDRITLEAEGLVKQAP